MRELALLQQNTMFNLLDSEGNPATGFQINEEYPITIYLHFDSDKFDGNLANLVIKYQATDMTWKTDGISNIRIEGATIAFDVNHLTRFAAFEENVAPANFDRPSSHYEPN